MTLPTLAALAFGALVAIPFVADMARTAARERRSEGPGLAGPVSAWPQPVPVRLEPQGRDEILITTLGPVQTPLADGTFDPVADRVTARDGRTLERYFKDTLQVPHYQPMDKSRFPVPPSGWCSWYYYFHDITPEEVLANARWVARHLAPYGARYAQIDDGWQGVGRGLGSNRDWTTIDPRFKTIGMKALAKGIRDTGLEPGLWLAPHGQSNEQVARSSRAFTWKPDGTTASDSWEGTYLIDPSAPAAHDYLVRLFRTLRSWGYSYFKIDGQPTVIREFTRTLPFMIGPKPPGTPDEAAAELYRGTLRSIRDAIGPESFLLTSWGIALPAIGLVNGGRTAGDVVQGWDGFIIAAQATQQWNFLHNIAWYSDPDVLEVRPPLSDGTARAWATIFALTGQALMASDRMTDLPEPRIELLRRVYPAVDIRPLDMFRPDDVLKPVVDLKVNHLDRQYDVVGLFNYDPDRARTRLLSWRELGLDPATLHHVFDFWSGSYLGAWDNGVFLDIPAADVRVVTVVPATDRPVLVSTSRHITQGWVDVLDLRSGGTDAKPALAGRSRVIAGDTYRLTIGLPRSKPTFAISAARARGSSASRPVRVALMRHQGYATVTIESATTQEVSWELEFEPDEPYVYPVLSPGAPAVSPKGLTGAAARWPVQYNAKAGYLVELDGAALGVAFAPRADLRDLRPGRAHRLSVRSIWYDGSLAPKPGETTFTLPAETTYLSDVEPEFARHLGGNAWRVVGRDRSVDGKPLASGGRRFQKGLGTHSTSEIRYDAGGAFTRFQALVGVDDEVQPEKPNEVVFEVWGDGRVLWKSGPVRGREAPVTVDVDITGVRDLLLKVLPGSDGGSSDHADWLEARVVKSP